MIAAKYRCLYRQNGKFAEAEDERSDEDDEVVATLAKRAEESGNPVDALTLNYGLDALTEALGNAPKPSEPVTVPDDEVDDAAIAELRAELETVQTRHPPDA